MDELTIAWIMTGINSASFAIDLVLIILLCVYMYKMRQNKKSDAIYLAGLKEHEEWMKQSIKSNDIFLAGIREETLKMAIISEIK